MGSRRPPADTAEPYFPDVDFSRISPPRAQLLRALLFYKSIFVSPWFRELVDSEGGLARGPLLKILRDTSMEVQDLEALVREWDRYAPPDEGEDLTQRVLDHLLLDVMKMKEASTEVLVATGMHAPTEELRARFFSTADLDRVHAGAIRTVIGGRTLSQATREHPANEEREKWPCTHAGPHPRGRAARTLEDALKAAKDAGAVVDRVIVSDRMLRRVQDENPKALSGGHVFGVAADVDLAWPGECFSLITRDRVSLAEIVTATSGTRERAEEDAR